MGRIVFDRALDNIFELDQLWSSGEVSVIDSSGPREYFNLTIPFPEMYCEATRVTDTAVPTLIRKPTNNRSY